MKEFLVFRKMVSPILVQIFFWIAVIFCIVFGFITMFHVSFLHGLLILVGGIIMARIYAEIIIVFFRINENVADIKDKAGKPS